jgi:hypothetical protein
MHFLYGPYYVGKHWSNSNYTYLSMVALMEPPLVHDTTIVPRCYKHRRRSTMEDFNRTIR